MRKEQFSKAIEYGVKGACATYSVAMKFLGEDWDKSQKECAHKIGKLFYPGGLYWLFQLSIMSWYVINANTIKI